MRKRFVGMTVGTLFKDQSVGSPNISTKKYIICTFWGLSRVMDVYGSGEPPSTLEASVDGEFREAEHRGRGRVGRPALPARSLRPDCELWIQPQEPGPVAAWSQPLTNWVANRGSSTRRSPQHPSTTNPFHWQS